jgi:hypothetical protein
MAKGTDIEHFRFTSVRQGEEAFDIDTAGNHCGVRAPVAACRQSPSDMVQTVS